MHLLPMVLEITRVSPQTEHERGYCTFGESKPLPDNASSEFRDGYIAHRWEQIHYLCGGKR